MEAITRNNNLSDQIFDLISNKIVRNELKPGEMIYETQISKDLGVSRSPVRDALHMLEQIRLVDKTPKGSYQVTSFTPELIRSLYDTAVLLYQYAFAKAAENATDADLAKMEQALTEMEKSIDGQDFELYLTNVTKLAKIILKTAGNPIIERMALELMPNAERVQWAAITNLPGQLKNIVEHLRRGYEFIADKQPEKAATAFSDFATTHINIVLSTLKESWEQDIPKKASAAN